MTTPDTHIKVDCKECAGIGKLDDLEPGDIGGNEWPCPDCNGACSFNYTLDPPSLKFGKESNTGITYDGEIHLIKEGKEIGRYWFEDGELMFEGNLLKSMKIIIETLCRK